MKEHATSKQESKAIADTACTYLEVVPLIYRYIDRNTPSCTLHVHWQGNIIVQLIWRLPLHMLVFVHNMYSTCTVYISYISRTNKHMALRPAVCLSLLRPTGGEA